MNDFLILPLIALAFLVSLGYFRGKRKNESIGKMIAKTTEEVLKPRESEYTNIGGTIGHHFNYVLGGAFSRAKGTFTLLPRHSLLYLPVSLVLRGHDSFYINLFTKRKLGGEGHLVSSRHAGRIERSITGMHRLTRELVNRDGNEYVLLYDTKKVREQLDMCIAELLPSSSLIHFCIYQENNTLFLHGDPSGSSFPQLIRRFRDVSLALVKKK